MQRRRLLAAVLLLVAPLPARAAAAALGGTWEGRWERAGATLAASFTFTVSGTVWAGTFASDDLRVEGIPLTDVEHRPPHVRWRLVGDRTTTIFDGTLAGDSLTGTFQETGEPAGTFTLHRATAVPPRLREEAVTFRNGEVTLAGTILLPAGDGPHPGIVLLQGSGGEGRWANRFLATRFAANGIAALVFDKRGVGDSTGDWHGAGFEDLAGDAAAAVAALRHHARVRADAVGIHGHSQGGTLAPLVAERVPDLAFVIASAATGLSMADTEAYSVSNLVGLPRLSGVEADDARAFVDAVVAHAYRGGPRAAVDAAYARVRQRPWAFEPPPEDDPYWSFARRIAGYDALAHWRHVRAPVLLVYGEADERTPVRPSAAAIAQAVLAGEGRRVEVRIFPSADHTFRQPPPPGGWPRTVAGYPQALVDWVLATLAAPPADTIAH